MGISMLLELVLIEHSRYADKGFLSELQHCIDHKFKRTRIKLLLSGSNISFMKDILKDKRGSLSKEALSRCTS